MKSNDCCNQRLFGGLQIWRELRRCPEKSPPPHPPPRLRTGQAVHRSGPRGGGPVARQRQRVGGLARRRGTRGARGLPRGAGAGVRLEPARDGAPTDLNQEQGAGEGDQGAPRQHPPPLGDFRPVEPRRYFLGCQVISGIGAREGRGDTTEVPPIHPSPGFCTLVCSKHA